MITITSDAAASAIDFRTCSIKGVSAGRARGFSSDDRLRKRSPRPAASTPARRDRLLMRKLEKEWERSADRPATGGADRREMDRDNRAARRLQARPFSFRLSL